MGAVSSLPGQDLAKMAEALVNLTAILMQMTADQDETVAEPVDVALVSKCDGFTWGEAQRTHSPDGKFCCAARPLVIRHANPYIAVKARHVDGDQRAQTAAV